MFFGIVENDSAILTPKNCDYVVNSIAITKFSEETPIINLYSADTVKNNDWTDNLNNFYPTEFLNSININGLPLLKLELKQRALVMLSRNFDANSGLCNGTTMKIISITTKIFRVHITNGSHIGDCALISRIELSPSHSLLPFKL